MLYKLSYFARMQSVQIKSDYSAASDAHGSFAKHTPIPAARPIRSTSCCRDSRWDEATFGIF